MPWTRPDLAGLIPHLRIKHDLASLGDQALAEKAAAGLLLGVLAGAGHHYRRTTPRRPAVRRGGCA